MNEPSEKKVKVLHIITRLDIGGSATNTIETVYRLRNFNYDTRLISGKTYDPGGKIAAELIEKNIQCVFLDDLVRDIHPIKDLKVFFQLYTFIRQEDYDIVHTHSSKAGILGRWAAWWAGAKYIVHTPHGHIFYGYFSKFKSAVFALIERIAALITDRIITLTDLGREDHLKFRIAPEHKFRTIYSGIDITQFKAHHDSHVAARKEYVIGEDQYLFGSVARLDPIKGNEYLIEAYAEVVKKHPKTKLLLVGDGDQKNYLKEKCQRLNILDHVLFSGFRQDVASCIYMMDCFVLASINEGMGRAILEAMACEKPIVATRTGGIPELIDDGEQGYLVPKQDPQSMARAMINVIEDPDRSKEMAKNAKKKVTDRFSLDKMIADIDYLYKELLAKKP